MKPVRSTLMILLVLAAPAFAQPKTGDHSGHHPAGVAPSSAATTAVDMTDGEVRKVDKDAARLTLRHGEIRNLGMPPMTMVFQFDDKAALAKLKPGDKVRFRAVSEAGKLVVTEIQVAR